MAASLQATRTYWTRSRVLAITACFIISGLDGFDIQVLGATAPAFKAELGFDAAQLGWLFGVSNVGFVAGSFVGGRLSDILDRRLALAITIALFGLGTIAFALQHSFTGFAVARSIAALGLGACMPMLLPIVAEISPPEARFKMTALATSGFPIGGLLAAAMTVISSDASWRTIFLTGGVLAVGSIALVRCIPAATEVVKADREALEPSARVSMALFGEGRAITTLMLWATYLLSFISINLLYYWLPLLLEGRGLSRAQAPQALLVFNLAALPSFIVFGWLCDRFGLKWPLLAGLLFAAAGFLGLSLATTLSMMLALSAVLGFCLFGSTISMAGYISFVYPANVRGAGTGATYAVGRCGAIVGPLAAGLLLAGNVSVADVLRVTAMIVVGAALSTAVMMASNRAATPRSVAS